MIRVYAGDTSEDRVAFRAQVFRTLRVDHGIVLTAATNNLTLSRNMVSISILGLARAPYLCGAYYCHVGFFGMKMPISDLEPEMDVFIDRFHNVFGDVVLLQWNRFDYGLRIQSRLIQLFKFNDAQCRAHLYREGEVHEMCKVEDYRSVDFRPAVDGRILWMKLYHLYHTKIHPR